MPRRGGELLEVRALEAGGADDVDEPGLRRQLGVGERRLGDGEVEHRLAAGEDLERVVLDDHADRLAAHRLADVPADPLVPGPLGDAAEGGAGRLADRLDQHPAHAPGGADHRDPDFVRHALALPALDSGPGR